MAAAPNGMTQPPSPGGAPPPGPPTGGPVAASPAAPKPSPQMAQGTQMAVQVVRLLQAIATAFPTTSPAITQINNLMRDVTGQIMEESQAPEPAAPPSGG